MSIYWLRFYVALLSEFVAITEGWVALFTARMGVTPFTYAAVAPKRKSLGVRHDMGFIRCVSVDIRAQMRGVSCVQIMMDDVLSGLLD